MRSAPRPTFALTRGGTHDSMSTFVDSRSVIEQIFAGATVPFRKPACVLLPPSGFSRLDLEPGSCRDIRASAPLIAWAIEQPCARTKDSPRLERKAELSGRSVAECKSGRDSRRCLLINDGVITHPAQLSFPVPKTTTKTEGPNPSTLDSQNGFNGRTTKAHRVPGSLPVAVKLSVGYPLACAARRHLAMAHSGSFMWCSR